MAAITAELEVLRGEHAPTERFDPRRAGVTPTGRPRPARGGLVSRAAVYGTGSWGTAFAAVLADAGTPVTMWGRRDEVVAQINAGVNEDYLPELRLPDTVRATTDPAEAAEGADVVVLAVPSQTLRDNLGGVGRGAAAGRRRRLAHEGRRARHDEADVRGHRRGRAGRGRPRRRRVRAQPGPRDRRQAARRVGRRLPQRGDGRAGRGRLCRTVLPPVHRRPTSSAPRSPGP